MRGLVLVAALAACDSGVVIEVHPAAGTKPESIDLFIGLDQCFVGDQPCPGIKPPGNFPSLLRGDVFHRNSNTQITVETDSDGVARVKLEPGGDGYIPLVVAVDDAQEAAAIVRDLDLGKSGKYIINLSPAGDQLGRSTVPGTYVQIWRKMKEPKTSCIGFELWTKPDGSPLDVDRYFVVPKEDQDCDDFDMTTFECNPFAFQSGSGPPIDKVSCMKPFDAGGAEMQCRLGGPSCTDGVMGGASCGPSEFCMPNEVCAACGTRTVASDLRACLGGSMTSPSTLMPRITCTLPLAPAADNTHLGVCPGKTTHISFDAQPYISLPVFSAPALIKMPTAATPMQFVDEIDIRTMETPSNVRSLRFKWKLDSLKAYYVEFSGEVTKTTQALEPAYVRFAVDKPTGSDSILLPLELVPKDCNAELECNVVGFASRLEDVWRCGN